MGSVSNSLSYVRVVENAVAAVVSSMSANIVSVENLLEVSSWLD